MTRTDLHVISLYEMLGSAEIRAAFDREGRAASTLFFVKPLEIKEILVRKSLPFATVLMLVGCQQTGAKHYEPCTLMTLDDAKSLIGTDAKRDTDAAPFMTTKDATCWYKAGPQENYDHSFLIVEHASGKMWLAFKEKEIAVTKKIDGLGDEAYFMNDSDTLWMRKGETVLIIEAYKKEKEKDQRPMEEGFARKVLSRL